MGAIADLDAFINLTTDGGAVPGDRIWMHKWDRVAGTAITFLQNRDYSLWTFDGQPSAGLAPGGTVRIPTSTTDGGLKQVDPTGGRQKWLHAMCNWLTNAQCSVLLYDRLLDISGLSGTVTTAQTVGGSITRYTGAEAYGNQAWVEVYSPLGATATTLSMSYTDQDGNAATSTNLTTIGGTAFAEQCRTWPIALAAGDTGVQGVTSVTLTATTGTAGDFGITIVRPLAMLNVAQVGGGGIRTYLESMPEIKTGACLALMILPHTVAVNRFGMGFAMVEA